MKPMIFYDKMDEFIMFLTDINLGVLVGRTTFNYLDFRIYPDKYIDRINPWYYYETVDALKLFVIIFIICYLFRFSIYTICRNLDKKRRRKAKNLSP